MFERFTDDARETVQRAQMHARRLGNLWVGTEHVLMAAADCGGGIGDVLASQGLTVGAIERAIRAHVAASDGADRDALSAIGIDLDRVQEALGAEGEPSPLEIRIDRVRRRVYRSRPPREQRQPGGALPFTPAAKAALELSLREALRLGQKTIEPEHLALGILRHGGGVAGEVLGAVRADVDALRADLEAAALASA